jgi:hypothetical protein
VTSYYAAQNAALAVTVRDKFAKIQGEIQKQRAATLSAWVKMAQQQQMREGGTTNPGTTQAVTQDINAAFDQMAQSIEIAQARILASLR